MNMTPLMSALGLSGGELLVILIVLLVMGIGAIGAVVLIVWLTSRNKKTPPLVSPTAPPPLSIPPVTQTTKRVCKQCAVTLPPDAPQGICPACLMKVGLGSQVTATSPSAQPRTPAPSIEEIAKAFPQLEIIELLGQGGMGMVYKARQPQLDRFVALKILAPDLSRDPAFAERFTREARALARLNHPNIVSVFDFGQSGSFCYLIMEYVDGLSLWQMEQARKRLAPEEALAIVPKICDALQYAHDAGIVHRDIKPANILIDTKGRVKIADFGLAKLIGQNVAGLTLTQSQSTMGTPQYMAPEQVEKPLTVDHRADIYSLGVVFYEMLTGELPLGRFSPPSARAQLDVRLDEVVLKSLEKEPERRYQQVSQVKLQVETIVGSPSGATRSPAPGSTQPPSPQLSIDAQDYATARDKVQGPAIGLMVIGSLSLLLVPVLAVFVGAITLRDLHRGPTPLIFLLFMVLLGGLTLVFGLTTLIAGVKMRKLQAYPLALAGSITTLLAPGLHLLGVPLGIWSLVVLNNPTVRKAFAAPSIPDNSLPPKKSMVPTVLIILGAGLAALLVIGIPFILLNAGHRSPSYATTTVETTQQIETSETLHDASEFTLNALPNHEACALSFKENSQKDLPSTDASKTDIHDIKPLAQAEGIDIVVESSNSFHVYDCLLLVVLNDQYDNLSMPIPTEGPYTDQTFSLVTYPTTFLFKTQGGCRGVLQVDKQDNPNELIFRYKLVQTPDSAPPGEEPVQPMPAVPPTPPEPEQPTTVESK